MTKNLTLAIDEDLLDRARVLAAMRRTSVNEMVRAFLQREIELEKVKDETTTELLRLARESKASTGGFKPNRVTTYAGESRFDR